MAIRALGFDVTKAHVLELMKTYDKQNTGFISQADFEEISERRRTTRLFAFGASSRRRVAEAGDSGRA